MTTTVTHTEQATVEKDVSQIQPLGAFDLDGKRMMMVTTPTASPGLAIDLDTGATGPISGPRVVLVYDLDITIKNTPAP